jgi:biotin operon repressor
MNSSSYFFRVEHDLLRSEAFKTLGGSAIKVYLVIGLYSDFGTDWAYPSIRTIARQTGLSRQTVLTAIEQLTQTGLLATSKSRGRSTAYRIIRQAPDRTKRSVTKSPTPVESTPRSGQIPLYHAGGTGPIFLDHKDSSVLETEAEPDRLVDDRGHDIGPKREVVPKADTASVAIPGTPFRLTADGQLLVTVDLLELLTNQGIPNRLAQQLLSQKDTEVVAKVLLNAFYLRSKGKLQNGPGYIRAGIEEGYDLLPQVASRLESRRRELQDHVHQMEYRDKLARDTSTYATEQAAVAYVLEHLNSDELEQLLGQARALLPEPIVRRNPTVSNPFIRAKIYELAIGESDS